MAKVLALFLAVALIWFFYPFRDLYVQDGPGENYQLVDQGFWTLDACRQAARERGAGDHLCRKRSGFSSLTSTYTRYETAEGQRAESL